MQNSHTNSNIKEKIAMGKVPYLFTVLLSIVAWTTNQLSIEIGKSPIIEVTDYSYDEATGNIEYLLTNVSNRILFSGLIFNMRFTEDICINDPDVKWLVPNKKHADTEAAKCENLTSAMLFVNQFQPSSQIKLQLKTNKMVVSNLLIDSKSAVRLVNSSLETFIVKNKLQILMYLFIVWVVLIGFYIVGLKKKWIEMS